MERNPEFRPYELMQRMLLGHFSAQCLHAAATLGFADIIHEEGSKSVEELASTAKCDPHSSRRLLRTLASMGVFAEGPDNRFSLTPLGATLRSNAPDSVRDMAIFMASQPIWSAWGSLVETIQSGAPSFPQLHGSTMYEFLAEHGDLEAVFNRFMSAQSNLHNAAIIEAYDFSKIQALVDVGGGHGATVGAILAHYPTMRGVVFDRPEVIATAEVGPAELAERCQFTGGNMLESVPAGGDAYLIKRVLMDRNDHEAGTVLKNCRAAMRPQGRVIVVDPMLPDDNSPHPNWLVDMNMLVVHGGACRTERQFSVLFESAGFAMSRVLATRSPNFILEAIPR
jgi:hypothetical protein